MFIALIGLIYLVCSVASAGFLFASFQGDYPADTPERRRQNLCAAIVASLLCGIFGPFGVLLACIESRFAEHGWRLWWKSDGQREEA